MIVDSSAVVAIVLNEPERDSFLALVSTTPSRISAANLLECSVVLDHRGSVAQRRLQELFEDLELEVAPFTADHARVARHAYQRFGKRSGSPARLNMGDCIAYALAATSSEPLLFKGEDFTHTDILPAI